MSPDGQNVTVPAVFGNAAPDFQHLLSAGKHCLGRVYVVPRQCFEQIILISDMSFGHYQFYKSKPVYFVFHDGMYKYSRLGYVVAKICN